MSRVLRNLLGDNSKIAASEIEISPGESLDKAFAFIPDVRSVNSQPKDYTNRSAYIEFKNRSAVGNPPINASVNAHYCVIITIVQYSSTDISGGGPLQISIGSKAIAVRQGGTGGTSWSAWSTI